MSMHLSDYLRPVDGDAVPASVLARKMGVSHTTVIRLANGLMNPSADMLLKLYEATDGQVTPNDMLGVVADSPATAPSVEAA